MNLDLTKKNINTAGNNGLHQLLGLRLLFCSSWKIIWWLQLYLSKKICRFVLVSHCSSNWCKLYTLSPIVEQVANRMITVSFALLLGLRLLFWSSWKIIWSFQFYLPKKIRSFGLVSVCSSNRRKAAGTLAKIVAKIEHKKYCLWNIFKTKVQIV